MKAVQSAMAIRRQRRRRDEAVRAKARRSSHQSDLLMLSDSLVGSQLSLDGLLKSRSSHQRQMSGVTAFHAGIVFLFLGLMLVISGIVPGYANQRPSGQQNSSSDGGQWSGKSRPPLLFGTGSFLIFIGIALMVANRIASRKEDEQFTRIIAAKLARSRHAHMTSSHSSRFNFGEHRNKQRSPDGGEAAADVMLNDSVAHSQSVNQLESIIEDEAEGGLASERTSKDRLYWHNELAPLHAHTDKRSHCSADGLINEDDTAASTSANPC